MFVKYRTFGISLFGRFIEDVILFRYDILNILCVFKSSFCSKGKSMQSSLFLDLTNTSRSLAG